jgi:MFS family permease
MGERAASRRDLLTRRNFAPYLAGNFLSSCGTWIQNLAQALLVFRLTGSSFLVGVVSFAQFSGVFLMAPWAGSAADRFDRRRLLIVTQVWSIMVTATLAILTAAHVDSTPVIIVCVLVLGLANAFAQPALQALVPLLVAASELPVAVALSSLTFTMARSIGPVIGAGIVAGIGIAWAFGLNSLSFLALVVALLVIHPRPQAPRPAVRPKLSESLRLVKADSRLLILVLAVVATSCSSDPITTLTPAFAKNVFGLHDTAAGLLIGAFGLGSTIAGATVCSRRNASERDTPLACAVLAVGMVGVALSPSLPFALVGALVGGLGFLWCNTTSMTGLMLGVDDSQRGRIMAVWSLAFMGTRPMASLVDGALASLIGVRQATIIMTLPCFIIAGWLLWNRARSRTPAAEVAQQAA